MLQYALDYPDDVGGLIPVGTGAKLRVAPHVLAAIEKGIRDSAGVAEGLRGHSVACDRGRCIRCGGPQAGLDRSLQGKIMAPDGQGWGQSATERLSVLRPVRRDERLHEIQSPDTALCGSLDVFTPPKYAAYLAEHMPRATMVIIEGGTHHFFAEKPEQTNRAISHFLKSL